MSDCCSNETDNTAEEACCSTKAPRKSPCPKCSHEGQAVGSNTLLHQLRFPFNQQLDLSEDYYFCQDPDCPVVYFDTRGNTYPQEQLRQAVGQKSRGEERTLCYCFDIHARDVSAELKQQGTSPSRDFVVKMTREKRCDCELRNPAGRCCLKDFPK